MAENFEKGNTYVEGEEGKHVVYDRFAVFNEHWVGIELLSIEQRGVLLTALFAWNGACEMPELDHPPTRAVFKMMLPMMEEWRARNRAKRPRVRDVPLPEWQRLRIEVFERDAYTCAYCGSVVDHPHCDHVVPLSRGGKSILENLVTACPTCNCSKGGKTLDEWRGN